MSNFDIVDRRCLETDDANALFLIMLTCSVFFFGVNLVRRAIDWGALSFIDSHCGKFECDSSTVDSINFRSDFYGTI